MICKGSGDFSYFCCKESSEGCAGGVLCLLWTSRRKSGSGLCKYSYLAVLPHCVGSSVSHKQTSVWLRTISCAFLRNCGEKSSTKNRLQLAGELLSSARGHGQGISTAFGNLGMKLWEWDNKQHSRPSAPHPVCVQGLVPLLDLLQKLHFLS